MLHIIGSSSQGNGYILQSEDDVLVIEAGVRQSEVKKVLNFDISKIAGVICTHEHL